MLTNGGSMDFNRLNPVRLFRWLFGETMEESERTRVEYAPLEVKVFAFRDWSSADERKLAYSNQWFWQEIYDLGRAMQKRNLHYIPDLHLTRQLPQVCPRYEVRILDFRNNNITGCALRYSIRDPNGSVRTYTVLMDKMLDQSAHSQRRLAWLFINDLDKKIPRQPKITNIA